MRGTSIDTWASIRINSYHGRVTLFVHPSQPGMSFKRREKTVPTTPSSQRQSSLNDNFRHSLSYLDAFGTTLTSTGIPSLDDILGGGLALTSIFTIFDPNSHSSYADLILKHFITQGILSHHKLLLVDLSGDDFIQKCPWVRPEPNSTLAVSSERQTDAQVTDPVQIAWRYEHLKQFSTTIEYVQPSTHLRSFHVICKERKTTCTADPSTCRITSRQKP
jgi:hypothetical protein